MFFDRLPCPLFPCPLFSPTTLPFTRLLDKFLALLRRLKPAINYTLAFCIFFLELLFFFLLPPALIAFDLPHIHINRFILQSDPSFKRKRKTKTKQKTKSTFLHKEDNCSIFFFFFANLHAWLLSLIQTLKAYFDHPVNETDSSSPPPLLTFFIKKIPLSPFIAYQPVSNHNLSTCSRQA